MDMGRLRLFVTVRMGDMAEYAAMTGGVKSLNAPNPQVRRPLPTNQYLANLNRPCTYMWADDLHQRSRPQPHTISPYRYIANLTLATSDAVHSGAPLEKAAKFPSSAKQKRCVGFMSIPRAHWE